jgi:hypothetical protein
MLFQPADRFQLFLSDVFEVGAILLTAAILRYPFTISGVANSTTLSAIVFGSFFLLKNQKVQRCLN